MLLSELGAVRMRRTFVLLCAVVSSPFSLSQGVSNSQPLSPTLARGGVPARGPETGENVYFDTDAAIVDCNVSYSGLAVGPNRTDSQSLKGTSFCEYIGLSPASQAESPFELVLTENSAELRLPEYSIISERNSDDVLVAVDGALVNATGPAPSLSFGRSLRSLRSGTQHRRRLQQSNSDFCSSSEELCDFLTESDYVTKFCNMDESLEMELRRVEAAVECALSEFLLGTWFERYRKGLVKPVTVRGREVLSTSDLKAIAKTVDNAKELKDFVDLFEDPIDAISGCWGPLVKVAACTAQTLCLYRQAGSLAPGTGNSCLPERRVPEFSNVDPGCLVKVDLCCYNDYSCPSVGTYPLGYGGTETCDDLCSSPSGDSPDCTLIGCATVLFDAITGQPIEDTEGPLHPPMETGPARG